MRTAAVYIPPRKKLRPAKVARIVLINLVLVIFSAIIAMPFFWMLTNSLKTKAEIWAKPPVLFPAQPQWQNFVDAAGDGYLLRYTFNSLLFAVVSTIIVLVNSAMFAYALTHVRMKGKTVFFTIIMVTYIMPTAVTNVPSYIILSKVKLIDSHLGLIISCSASIFSIFYFRQMFGQISPSIIESAKIDGARHLRILWSIVAPMSFSSFVTLGVFSFIGGYNSYVWPSLVLKTKSKFLVSQGLQLFFVAEGAYGLKWGAIMAACTVIVVPLFVLFAFCEKYIVAGISSDSAVKE